MGWMSRKATTRGDRYTKCAWTAPLAIRQKMHSLMLLMAPDVWRERQQQSSEFAGGHPLDATARRRSRYGRGNAAGAWSSQAANEIRCCRRTLRPRATAGSLEVALRSSRLAA